MKRTRRDVLRNASTLSALAAGVGLGTSVSAQEYPAWNPETAYTEGDRVRHDGAVWEAKWWTRGDEPGEGGEWGPWNEIGPADPGPSASITPSTTNPEPGQEIEFDGTSSTGEIVTYDWSFGDGTGATGSVVTHTYGESGRYDVELTVTDADGESDTARTIMSVGDTAPPAADRWFAPYQGTWQDIVGETLNANTNRVVLSFVGDGTDDGDVTPGWLAGCNQPPCDDEPLETYLDEIQTLQDEGIEVGVAIGGWQGRVVARDAESATELKDAYAEILDTLGVTHLDIDDENAHRRDRTIYELRNEALAMLQAERPNVTVGYTVPATENGIANSEHAQARTWVEDAATKGVNLAYVNIMTMGMNPTTTDKIVSACEGTVDFLGDVYPDKSEPERWALLGNTPDIAENSITTEVAADIVAFADEQGMGHLSYWALYNDPEGEFSEIYADFEDGPT
ncbi:PKD domain-containing protein [Natrialba aegyptia]|uniref:PKD domain containing protein n=1 Tax=Natrialba aegyptia DSM 13077 TaxID=1227491 RepID=M0AHA4_9EURY|nr:PKD domain-containing protein [Natrialba aegyptia]ELY97756.1 PKD domain containing protein [Natrialba aegyptia DSM 13077]